MPDNLLVYSWILG